MDTIHGSKKRGAILFANLKGNLGDFAILDAMLFEIKNKFSIQEVDIFPHPLVDIDDHRLQSFLKNHSMINICDSTHKLKISRLKKNLAHGPLRRKMQKSLINQFSTNADTEAKKFTEYDAIFVAGGDQWSGKELGYTMFGTINAIAKYNNQIYSFPFSLKKSILSLYSQKDLKGYFDKIKSPLVTRDSLSHEIFGKINIKSELGADSVYGLVKKSLDISANNARNKSRILFMVKGKENEIRSSLKLLVSHYDCIEMISTCSPEDGAKYSKISAELNIPYHEPNTWQEAISEIKSSSLIITNRLHGLIFSSIAETPILPVINRSKSKAYARDADLPFTIENLNDVSAEIIKKSLDDRENIIIKMIDYRFKTQSMI